MQPCAICGSVAIDSAGHCAQCGTFRGLPGYPQQPGYGQPQPGYAPPPAAQGYPVSGGPGYPSSGGPGYPTSGVPGHPAAGGYVQPGYPQAGGAGYPPPGGPPGYPPDTGYPDTGYPARYPVPPGQPNRGRSLLVPLIALGATLVVLVVAITVIVVVRGGDRPTTTADPTATPTATPTAGPTPTAEPSVDGLDNCVVGDWRVTSHTEQVQNEDLGRLEFTGGEGASLTLNPDGTGLTDYGSGTEFESTWEGKPIVLEIRGSYTYRFRTDDGQVTLSELRSNAEARVLVDGDQFGQWIDFRPSGDTASYTCSGNTLTQKSLLYTTRFARES